MDDRTLRDLARLTHERMEKALALTTQLCEPGDGVRILGDVLRAMLATYVEEMCVEYEEETGNKPDKMAMLTSCLTAFAKDIVPDWEEQLKARVAKARMIKERGEVKT